MIQFYSATAESIETVLRSIYENTWKENLSEHFHNSFVNYICNLEFKKLVHMYVSH